MQYINYNYDDPDIRALVKANHAPTELSENAGTTNAKLTILCRQCFTAWPCAPIVSVRNVEAQL